MMHSVENENKKDKMKKINSLILSEKGKAFNKAVIKLGRFIIASLFII